MPTKMSAEKETNASEMTNERGSIATYVLSTLETQIYIIIIDMNRTTCGAQIAHFFFVPSWRL